ncbi:MAG: phosphatidate cytidylyltransferase [Treponemataceae bacterium]|nr:phosphatidate cytidylyltransferase [Treponemataceae bacterium]
MNTVFQRLFVFFLGIPLVILITAATFCNHLILHLTIIAVAIISTLELHKIVKTRNHIQPLPFVLLLTTLIPFITYITVLFDLSTHWISLTFVASFLLVMAKEIFGYDKETASFEKSIQRISSSFFIIFYCGYLISFVSRMTSWEEASVLISFFLLLVFGSDSIAWLFGMLLGKNNKNIFKASPNKSIAGYIGGVAGPLLIGLVGWKTVPYLSGQSLLPILIISFVTALTSIIGDLVESVIKRSSNFKDSGHVIPGRGGLLDSIDSILFSAPSFFLLTELFFGL